MVEKISVTISTKMKDITFSGKRVFPGKNRISKISVRILKKISYSCKALFWGPVFEVAIWMEPKITFIVVGLCENK